MRNALLTRSAQPFACLSGVALVLGAMVISPAGGFFLSALAGLAALIPIAGGKRWVRLTGVVLLTLSLLAVVNSYPEYRAEMSRYREHTR